MSEQNSPVERDASAPKEKHNLRWDRRQWEAGMAKCRRIGCTMTDVMERALNDFVAEDDQTAALRLESRLAVTIRQQQSRQ